MENAWDLRRRSVAILVEPVAFAIVLEDGAEDPAVAVEVGELRVLQLGVEFRAADLVEKFVVAPYAAGRGAFGIAQPGLVASALRSGLLLLRRIHFVAVGFVVPPDVAEIGGDHVGAGVDVADHALAGGDGAREGVLDGMARFVLGDGGIGRRAEAASGRTARRGRSATAIAVVGVDDVAGGAAAGAIVAGMVVGAGQGHDGIEQARFLQAEENGIGAQFGAEAAIAELVVGLAGILLRGRDCRFRLFCGRRVRRRAERCRAAKFPSARADRVAGGRPWSRSFFGVGGGNVFMRLRLAVAVVAFAEAGVLVRVAAVVVERGAPEHAGVGHHAGGDSADFVGVAVGGAAGFGGDAEIAGVDEFDVVGGFTEPFGEEHARGCERFSEWRSGRLDVGFLFGGGVFG